MAELKVWIQALALLVSIYLAGRNAWERNFQGMAGWTSSVILIAANFGAIHG